MGADKVSDVFYVVKRAFSYVLVDHPCLSSLVISDRGLLQTIFSKFSSFVAKAQSFNLHFVIIRYLTYQHKVVK